MKNILIIQESLNGGGAEKVLIELLNNIDYSKYQITLLLVYYNGRYIKQVNDNVTIKYIYKNKRPSIKRILARTPIIDFIEKFEINRVLGNSRFDTIISFMEGITLKYHSHIMNKSLLNISWVHVNLIVNPWSTKIFRNIKNEKNIYKKLDKIVFVSEKVKDAFKQKFQISAPEEKVLYNIINREKIQALSNEKIIDKRCFTICNVGRLAPIKKQDRLIKAVKLLIEKKCNIELWILGEGKEYNRLQSLISNLRLNQEVHLLGFKSNPYPYIKAADVFVLSSDTEGYPTVVCEALCLGKPIITTRITGCTELLGNNNFGILTDLNEEAIANAIYDLYNSKDKTNYFKQKALERANYFNVEYAINEFYKVIDK